MHRLALLSLASLAAAPLTAQCAPLALSWIPGTVSPYETALLRAIAPSGTLAVIGFDELPGPTFVPGIGDIMLGLSPVFATLPLVMPASGSFDFPFFVPCKEGATAFYTQALTLDPTGLCLSNPAQLHVQHLGPCNPLACVEQSTIHSNFNGTSIAAGNWIWFNAIVRVGQVPPAGTTIGYRNASIQFTSGVPYVLPVPNALITFDPLAQSAATAYDPILGQFTTVVPASTAGNVFLSGFALQLPTGLNGGINPVSWTGEFTSQAAGVTFQWKWAAAVYTSFSGDYNAVCVKPVDGSAANPYANSDHAGTPECFKAFVIGGARGGGGSNFTGSYSGTTTASCN